MRGENRGGSWKDLTMKRDGSGEHPIRVYFADALHRSLVERLGMREVEDVEAYLTELLVTFLHEDRIYAIRDTHGRRVQSVAEMIVEGDVRLNADSFDREREVHRHIGDFLLFWSGIFPEFLHQIKAGNSKDSLVDLVRQGQFSYRVVSSFEHDPYGQEAPVFKKLSEEFEMFRTGLGLVRASFEGFARQGWTHGFEA
jgi:hypothetical protein